MNEILIKELIKCKLNAASTIIGHLPPETAEEIRSFGRVILESLNESYRETNWQPSKKSKPSDKLSNVPIE